MAGENSNTEAFVRNLPPPPVEVAELRALIASAGNRRDVRFVVRRGVFDLWTSGYSETQIAAMLGLTAARITSDLRAYKAFWRELALQSGEEHVAEILARFDRAERELWQAWERSKYPARKRKEKQKTVGIKTETGEDGALRATGAGRADVESQTDTQERVGDPRFMAGILEVQRMRAAVLGVLRTGRGGTSGGLPGANGVPTGGKGLPIYMDDLFKGDSIPETEGERTAYLTGPESQPADGVTLPRPPDIDDPDYNPLASGATVVELTPRANGKANGNGKVNGAGRGAEDDDEDGGDDDDGNDYGL